jgi:hypothetical protein
MTDMKTLYESILTTTKVKTASVKNALHSLGNVFSLTKINIFPTISTGWAADQFNGSNLADLVKGKKFLTKDLENKVSKLSKLVSKDRFDKLSNFFLWLDNVDVSNLNGELDPNALVDTLSANVIAYDLIYNYNTTLKGIYFCYIEQASDEECVLRLSSGSVRLCEITIRKR